MQLALIRNPFDEASREVRTVDVDRRLAIADLLAQHVPECLPGEFHVALNGQVITAKEWATRTLGETDVLAIVPVPGKDAFKSILRIVIVAAFAYAGGLAAGALGFGGAGTFGAAVGSAIGGMIGGAVANALVPPVKPKLPGVVAGSSYDNSPTYAWAPVTTQEAGMPVARGYGRFKLYGNVIGGYLLPTGEQGQEQIAKLMIELGQGPYSALNDIRLNDQPIDLYTGVVVDTRLGQLDQVILPDFDDTRSVQAISAKVVNGVPVVREVAGTDYDALEIALSFPNGLYYANDRGGLDSISISALVEISADGGSTWVEVEPDPVWNLDGATYK